MKILAVHNFYRTFGGEDSVFTQDVALLRAAGTQVVEYARRSEELVNERLPWRKAANAFGIVYNRRTVREVRAIVREHRPDVALVQNVFPLVSPSVYYVLDAERIPIVQLLYNYRWICPNASLYTRGRICEACIHGAFRHAVRNVCCQGRISQTLLYTASISLNRKWGRVMERMDALITPDRFLKEKMIEAGLPADRIHPVHNPFDARAISPAWPHNGYVLFVGRLERHKGVYTLLKAMELLSDIPWRVVGAGPEEEEVRRQMEAFSPRNGTFLGYRMGEAMLEQMRGAAAVVVPTEWYDNAPLIVDQAFACGKPVIASRIDGIPEVVEHEATGLLFAPGDANGLAGCIRRLLSDEPERLRLAHNARRKAESEFTAERRLQGLRFVFDSAMAVRRNR